MSVTSSSHPVASAYSALPVDPYTRDEIKTYVRRHFDDRFSTKPKFAERKRETETRVIDYLMTLPAWAQVLLVEYRVPIQLGTRRALRLGRGEAGESSVLDYTVKIRADELKKPNEEAEYTLSHELAHSIDSILGDYIRLPRQSTSLRASFILDDWITALGKELKRYPKNLINSTHAEMSELLNHPIYDAKEKPTEAFAFMVSVFFMKYFRQHRLRADVLEEGLISQSMEKDFHYLWPCFRDKILPIAYEDAACLYAERRRREARAEQILVGEMQLVIARVAERYQCALPPGDGLSRRLALSHTDKAHYFPDWHSLFSVLVDGGVEQPTLSRRMKLLFPTVFDPLWGAPVQPRSSFVEGLRDVDVKSKPQKPYSWRSFPELRVQAETFAKDFSDILRSEGIESFVEHYQHLLDAFQEAIEQRKSKSRNR